MDICLQGDNGLIMCTESVSEAWVSDAGTGWEQKEVGLGPGLEQDAEIDICLTSDTGLVIATDSVSEAWESETGGWGAGVGFGLMDI